MTRAGFPHSDILGSRFVCQLPEAYRRLPRPSSAPSAKASTLCPYKLDHKDHSKMLASTVQFSSYDRFTEPTAGAVPTHVERYDRPGPARRPSPHRDSRRRPDPGTSPEYNNLPAVPSGPNSVPSQPLRPVDLRSLPTASCRRTRSHRPSKPASSRCSTLEHHLAIVRRERGPGQPHPPMTGELAARCSLERR